MLDRVWNGIRSTLGFGSRSDSTPYADRAKLPAGQDYRIALRAETG